MARPLSGNEVFDEKGLHSNNERWQRERCNASYRYSYVWSNQSPPAWEPPGSVDWGSSAGLNDSIGIVPRPIGVHKMLAGSRMDNIRAKPAWNRIVARETIREGQL
jgi:hypothetical protein